MRKLLTSWTREMAAEMCVSFSFSRAAVVTNLRRAKRVAKAEVFMKLETKNRVTAVVLFLATPHLLDVFKMDAVSCTDGAEESALEVLSRIDSRACQNDFSSIASFGKGVFCVSAVRLLSSLIQPFTDDWREFRNSLSFRRSSVGMAVKSRGEEGAVGFSEASWARSSSTIFECGASCGGRTLVECWEIGG